MIVVRPLEDADKPYVISSWRESHKQSPGCDKAPWDFYKWKYGTAIAKIIDDPSTKLFGAYGDDTLAGYLVMTPGKRVNTLHWVQTRFNIGADKIRRRGIMALLLAESGIANNSFIYTLRARRIKNVPGKKSLDEVLADYLLRRNIVATYVPLLEWLK